MIGLAKWFLSSSSTFRTRCESLWGHYVDWVFSPYLIACVFPLLAFPPTSIPIPCFPSTGGLASLVLSSLFCEFFASQPELIKTTKRFRRWAQFYGEAPCTIHTYLLQNVVYYTESMPGPGARTHADVLNMSKVSDHHPSFFFRERLLGSW